MWTVPKETLNMIERECYHKISAPPGIAPTRRRPLSHPGELQTHQWLTFTKVFGKYLIQHCYVPDTNDKALAASRILDLITLCTESYVTVASLNKIRSLVKEIRRTFRNDFPDLFKSVTMHVLLFHIPDLLARWGPSRNWWCFDRERYVI